MGGTYTLGADGMYYPDLELSEEEPHYGKYGRMRLYYLKENRKVLYYTLHRGALFRIFQSFETENPCNG